MVVVLVVEVFNTVYHVLDEHCSFIQCVHNTDHLTIITISTFRHSDIHTQHMHTVHFVAGEREGSFIHKIEHLLLQATNICTHTYTSAGVSNATATGDVQYRKLLKKATNIFENKTQTHVY